MCNLTALTLVVFIFVIMELGNTLSSLVFFRLFLLCILQVAQFILDDAIEQGCGSTCRVICTQPRRISAISVSAIFAAV